MEKLIDLVISFVRTPIGNLFLIFSLFGFMSDFVSSARRILGVDN